jgi:hypothetical protein
MIEQLVEYRNFVREDYEPFENFVSRVTNKANTLKAWKIISISYPDTSIAVITYEKNN